MATGTESGEQFEAICDRFEAEWQAGERPAIEACLEKSGPTLLRELLYIELSHRRRHGETLSPEEYQRRFPDHAQLVQEVFSQRTPARCSISARPTSGIRIRCPHCRNPIEVADDSSLDEIECPSCGSSFSLINGAATETHWPNGPRRIAHFELLLQVGVGGFGSVWKARDTILDRTVALKIPRVSQLSDDEVEFFFRDARAAAQLRHPGIVSVHEVGRDGDIVFIASDYIDGANLKEWLSAQRPTVHEAAELVVKIAEAVQHAHEHGVVHRDLKPANILLNAQGEPHVADFGLAKREAGEISVTLDGQVIGTAQYMSPEQATGKGHHADARSDVYSLGVILFELLTGELPFRGDKRMLLLQIANEEPPRPRKFNARVPRDLETICLKCLEKDPKRRYGTAQELADDLKRFLNGEPIVARPVTRAHRAWRWAKRNAVVAGLAGVLLVMLLSVAVVSPIVAVRQSQLRQDAQRAEAERADQLWRSYLAQSRANRLSGQPGRRFKSLDALRKGLAIIRERAVPEGEYVMDFRNEAIAAMALVDLRIAHEREVELTTDHEDWPGISVDRQMQHYAQIDKNGTVRIRNLHDNRLVVVLPGVGMQSAHSQFSSDGRFLAVTYGTPNGPEPKIRVWDLHREKLVLELFYDMDIIAFAFSSDSRMLAVGSKRAVELYDLQRGITSKGSIKTRAQYLVFSRDGSKLVVGDPDRSLAEIYGVKNLNLIASLRDPRFVRGMDLSPDGKILALGGDREIRMWELESRTVTILRGHQSLVTYVAFNSSGKLLATKSWDWTIRLWDVAARREVMKIPGGGRWTPLCFSRDDRQLGLIWNGPSFAIFDVDPGRELRRLRREKESEEVVPGFHRGMDFSPDGRWLAVADLAGIHLWDSATDSESARLNIRGRPNRVAFAGDGASFITNGPESIDCWSLTHHPALGTAHIGLLHSFNRAVQFQQWGPNNEILALQQPGQIVVADLRVATPKLQINAARSSPVISPDGRWIAAVFWQQPGLHVWDGQSGKLLRKLPVSPPAGASLSPDGHLLVVSNQHEFRAFDTTSWEVRYAIQRTGTGGLPGERAFSADSKLLAVADTSSTLKLVHALDGRPIATLQQPYEQYIQYFCFSRDGSQLAVSYSNTDTIDIWDLRLIRSQLAELGLDWDLPPVPPADKRLPSLKVTVDLGQLCAEEPARPMEKNGQSRRR